LLNKIHKPQLTVNTHEQLQVNKSYCYYN